VISKSKAKVLENTSPKSITKLFLTASSFLSFWMWGYGVVWKWWNAKSELPSSSISRTKVGSDSRNYIFLWVPKFREAA
jgi:hypothetical protein